MRIDAHLHFWRPDCGFDNRPIADNAAYRRDFMPDDVRPAMTAAGIDAAVLVQSAPQVEETAWNVDLARGIDWIAGITGWVDLDAEAVDCDALCRMPKIVGVRAQLRRIADDAFVSRPRVIANMRRVLEAGLSLTLLIEHRHYTLVTGVVDRLGPGPVIVNHLALAFADVPRDEWRTTMRRLASRDATYLQLSGVPFLYGPSWRDNADAETLMDEALDIFGPGRLLFASDWPMMVRFTDYRQWVEAVESLLAKHNHSTAEIDAVFGGNARAAHSRLELPLAVNRTGAS
jgi:L-fuconolactonase